MAAIATHFVLGIMHLHSWRHKSCAPRSIDSHYNFRIFRMTAKTSG